MTTMYDMKRKVLLSQVRVPDFIILVDTTLAGSAPDTMIIPTTSSGHSGYDCTVDWGDGTTDTYTGAAPTISHTYAVGGEKTIKISGTFPRIYFNNSGDKAKLLSVLNWGNYGIGVADQERAFWDCVNNTSIAEDWKLDEWLTNGTNMFLNNQLTKLPDGMTLSELITGNSMFYANQLQSLPDGMTLGSLTDGGFMFYNNQLTKLPDGMTLSELITGNSMFYANQLQSLPDGIALNRLTNGTSMFRDNQLQSLPDGMTLDVLTNGNFMFQGNQLTSLPDGMTLDALTSGINMFFGNTINTTDYSELLVNIAANNNNTGVNFHGGNSKYNASGETARNQLTVNQSWSINDGGLEI